MAKTCTERKVPRLCCNLAQEECPKDDLGDQTVVTTICHEMRNIVATTSAAIQFFDMLRDTQPTKYRALHQQTLTELDRLGQLINHLTEKDLHSSKRKLEPIDLRCLLQEMSPLIEDVSSY